MKTITVYENPYEAWMDFDKGKLKRGDEVYILASKPKVKKDIHLFRFVQLYLYYME